MFKPCCGLFNKFKYLPLRYMPIVLELELADNDAPRITKFNTALLQQLQVFLGEFKLINSTVSF